MGSQSWTRLRDIHFHELPTPEVRGGGQEEQTHLQGAAAARAQEGWEELLHIEQHEKAKR